MTDKIKIWLAIIVLGLRMNLGSKRFLISESDRIGLSASKTYLAHKHGKAGRIAKEIIRNGDYESKINQLLKGVTCLD